MTNSNYTNCTNKELVDEINNLNKRPDVLDRYLKNHHNDLYSEVVKRTIFLDNGFFNGKSVPILARIYCMLNDIVESPRCHNPNCSNFVEWRNGRHEFAEHCCWDCYKEDPNSHHKENETKLLKYGDSFYNNPNKRVATAKRKWGDGNYCNRKKFKETCICKFGGNAPACLNEVVDKMKETKLERYGDSGFNNHEKSIETCRILYGVDNVSQIDGIQEKVRQTNIERYGAIHINKTEDGKKRICESMMRKYGVEYPAQSYEYHKNKKHKYHSKKYIGLTFDSTWEVKVYEFCMDNKILIDYSPSISFKYEYGGKIHTYHPDFLINGKLYEVKGEQFFRINESTGQEEMYCPWKGNLTDEEYEFKCSKEEAKHQCILRNGVTILRESQINNLTIDMFN